MRYRSNPAVRYEESEGVVVLSQEDSRFFILRDTARFLWMLLGLGSLSRDEIVAACVAEFQGDERTIRTEVLRTLEDWEARNLVVAEHD